MFTFLTWFALIGICLLVAPVVLVNALYLLGMLFRLFRWFAIAASLVLVIAIIATWPIPVTLFLLAALALPMSVFAWSYYHRVS